MATDRDAQIVEWLGRVGAAGAEHVAQQFGMGPKKAYGRLCALSADGLVTIAGRCTAGRACIGRPGRGCAGED